MGNTINESAIKKLKLLFTVVARPKSEFYLDVLSQFDVNFQMVLSGRGTANSELLELLGLETHKAVILSVVREDLVDGIVNCLEDKFRTVRNGKGTIGTKGASVSLGTTVKTGYTYLGAVVLRHQNAGNFWISFSRNTSNNNVYADCYRANASAVNGMAITIRKMWASTKITGIPE